MFNVHRNAVLDLQKLENLECLVIDQINPTVEGTGAYYIILKYLLSGGPANCYKIEHKSLEGKDILSPDTTAEEFRSSTSYYSYDTPVITIRLCKKIENLNLIDGDFTMHFQNIS